jgi:hypothetical protein
MDESAHTRADGPGSAMSGPATSGSVDSPTEPQGPGCLPAVMAATLLMGIIFFIMFAFSAWLIFQKRGDLAIRTLRATIIPELEQSRLDPDEKRLVINELSALADDMEQGRYENWQAGGIMQRLINSPIMRWGDLVAVDGWAEKNLDEEQRLEARKQISRFFRAIELDRAVARDIHDVLGPVSTRENEAGFVQLRSDLRQEDVREVAHRAQLVADRAQVPDDYFEVVSLSQFVRRQIEIGSREGAT